MTAGCFGKSAAITTDEDGEPTPRGHGSNGEYVLRKINSIQPNTPGLDQMTINLICINLEDIQEEDGGAQANAECQASLVSVAPKSHRFCRVESMKQGPGLTWSNSRRALEVLVDREEAHSRVHCNDPMTHAQRLEERLDRLNLQVFEMEGDGNCQFRSISHELYGTQEHYKSVRKKVIAYITSHPDTFSCFLGEDFEDYLHAMSQDRCWGDELTLRAACEAYGMIMHIVSSDAENWHLVYKPAEKKCNTEVFITYIAPIHYNAIRRKPSLKLLHQQLGQSFKRMSSSRSSGISDDSR